MSLPAEPIGTVNEKIPTVSIVRKKKPFTQIYLDNFMRVALVVTLLGIAYIAAAHFGFELFLLVGVGVSAVIAFFLSVIEVIRKR